jgi:NDP-sugar pyrophosphorylase family protein
MAPKSRLSEVVKPPVDLSSSIIISDGAVLQGTHPIRIGDHTVIHPRVRLNSTLGPITIGDYCIINERAILTAQDADGLTIENHVVVETNAHVEARRIGKGSTIEAGVRVGKGAVIGQVRRARVWGWYWLVLMMDRIASSRRLSPWRMKKWSKTIQSCGEWVRGERMGAAVKRRGGSWWSGRLRV